MKIILFLVVMTSANLAMACSVTPMGYYKWTMDAVTEALANDPSASFFEIVSVTNTGISSQYAVILKNGETTETRIYKVREKSGTVCGEYEAIKL